MFAESVVVGDQCPAVCFMPSLSRGSAFSAGGPKPDLPHTAGGQPESTAPRMCSGDAVDERSEEGSQVQGWALPSLLLGLCCKEGRGRQRGHGCSGAEQPCSALGYGVVSVHMLCLASPLNAGI